MTPPPGGIQPIPQTPIVKGGDFVENMNQKNPFSQQLTGFGETLKATRWFWRTVRWI
jgi:hypothetical protein